jgi:transposase
LNRPADRDIAGKTRLGIAAEGLAELVAIEATIKKSTAELKAMVLTRRSRLMDLHGVAPVVAARILADVGDPVRQPEPIRLLGRHRTMGRLLRRADPPPTLASREPADEPYDPHRRGQPTPPRHPRPRLLPAQAAAGKTPLEALRCLKR